VAVACSAAVQATVLSSDAPRRPRASTFSMFLLLRVLFHTTTVCRWDSMTSVLDAAAIGKAPCRRRHVRALSGMSDSCGDSLMI
jgi:hypothetical protein